jgi:hypothetical protein
MLTNIHITLAESDFCNKNRKAIKLQIVADSVTWSMWIREKEWLILTPSTIGHGSGHRNVLLSVKPCHSKQLYSAYASS